MRLPLLLPLCSGALVAVLGLPTDVNAAMILVNDLTDVVSNDGRCTLREAITAAETDTASGSASGECGAGSGTDIVSLPSGRIHLTGSTPLNVNTMVFVIGTGPTSSVIDAGGMSDTAIRVHTSGFLELQSLGFENAWVDPAYSRGGIHVGGFFVARGSRFAHNFGFVGVMDVILGKAVILDSVFEHNACDVSPWSGWGVDWGGTIGASHGGEVDVGSSTFRDNFCDSHGGALNGTSGAVITVEDTVFTRNDVTLGGGAISVAAAPA
ncbi:MAG: CSLREA domain-containing protein [Nannocystales bacterium]